LTCDGDTAGDRLNNLGAGGAPTDAMDEAQLDAAEKGQVERIAALDASGKVPYSRLPLASTPTIILSGTGHGIWIDLDSTSEQMLRVPHGRNAVPNEREVFFGPVAAVGLDVRAVCLDHIKYLAARIVFATKLREGSGTGQQGQLGVLTFAG
jgi:hypothetical protein